MYVIINQDISNLIEQNAWRRSYTRVFRYATLVMLNAFVCTSIYAQTSLDSDTDETAKLWEEIATTLPAIPQTADLIEFEVSASATQTFAIDEKSLSVGSDGVIRYTVVTASQSGAKNIRYEGIRCASFERRLYATGRADGTWTPARHNQWQPIFNRGINRIPAALAQDYMCLNNSIAGTSQDILRRLRRHQRLGEELRS